MNSRKLIFEAESMIQRDALVHHLKSEGIEAFGIERDLSRKYADTSVDLAYEGYSATMGGFGIFVDEVEADRASALIQSFLKSTSSDDKIGEALSKRTHLERFYGLALFSLVFPILPPIGAYYLYKGLRSGEPIRPPLFFFSLLLLVLALVVWTAVILTKFEGLVQF